MANLNRWMGEEVEWTMNNSEYTNRFSSDFIDTFSKIRLLDGSKIVYWKADQESRVMFRNGGFSYIDNDLVETCTPECRNHYELVRYNRAMEIYMQLTAVQYSRNKQWLKKEGLNVNVWKSNVDSEKISRGVHESYDTDRGKFIHKMDLMIPYLTFRQLFAGSGGYYGNEYVISPRAMTTGKVKDIGSTGDERPILNAKDESLSTEDRFRFHQTLGDGLRGDVPNLLKCGITSYLIAAIEENIVKNAPSIAYPADAIKKISENLSGPWKIKLYSGRRFDVVEYLYSDVLESIEKLFRNRDISNNDKLTLDKYKYVMKKLSAGSLESLRGDVEWINKKYLIDNYTDSMEFSEDYDELEKKKAVTFAYTDVANDDVWMKIKSGTLNGLSVTNILSENDTKLAVLLPPNNSRADFRVWLANKYGSRITELGWNHADKFVDRYHQYMHSLDFPQLSGWHYARFKEMDKKWGERNRLSNPRIGFAM